MTQKITTDSQVHSEPLLLSAKAHNADAGYDLKYLGHEGYRDAFGNHHLSSEQGEKIVLAPLGRVLVKTDSYIDLPEGFVGFVCPRSGLAAREGITVLNAPGIVDAGYTGEIKVSLINLSNQNVVIPFGSRIAQLVISSLPDIELVSGKMGQTERGDNGFGSTGKN